MPFEAVTKAILDRTDGLYARDVICSRQNRTRRASCASFLNMAVTITIVSGADETM